MASGVTDEARKGYDTEKLRKCVTDCYPSVLDRYYRKFYKINLKGHEGEDYCVLLHSNRICLITLAPSHPVVKEKKTVIKVDFQINKRTNRLQNPLSGKRKRGAQQLVEDAALCIVKCDDGSVYQPCGCLKGSLVEANENLVTKPHLLSTKPDTEGYIAIVLTKLQDHKQEIAKLLTPEQYHDKLQEREKKQHWRHCEANQVLNKPTDNDTDINREVNDITDVRNINSKQADGNNLTKNNQSSEENVSIKLITVCHQDGDVYCESFDDCTKDDCSVRQSGDDSGT